MNIIKDLQSRGLIQDVSDPNLDEKLSAGTCFYCGFDPTAVSLHLGNFLPIMTMLRLASGGLKPIMLFGGATGQVGDPTGKTTERPILSLSEIENNVNAQKNQAQAIFERLGYDIEFVDNSDWTSPVSVTTFLREVGKYITVNYMLAKDSVKTRIQGEGMSFAEFSYMLIQANDFRYLFENKNCKLQIGGSDQWGNITCGLELIRKKLQKEVHAFSVPLLTNSAGKKYGKSEEGALWLNPEMTSPYKLHQFLLNTPDADVIKLITQFTFAEQTDILEFTEALETAPEKRAAQQYLADEVCTLIHGEEATNAAKNAAQVLFGGSVDGIPAEQLLEIFKEVPSYEVDKTSLTGSLCVDLLVSSGAIKSKGEARRLIDNGGVYLNNERVNDVNSTITDKNLIEEKLLVLRTGKKKYHLIKINE